MKYIVTADTDIGIIKNKNQDSLLVKHASSAYGEILMAVMCDGMGGLAKGELASAIVVREFSRWFDEELSLELEKLDMQIIGYKWSLIIKDINLKILENAQKQQISMGTTFTGILFVKNQYVIVHVGDTRIYHIGTTINQLTEDQTFVHREVKLGLMSKEQAQKDKRRNLLLQCVGASERLEPEIINGLIKKGTYLLCSDGFRHEISELEIYEKLRPLKLVNKKTMHRNTKYLISQVKKRHEKDNISVILIKVE